MSGRFWSIISNSLWIMSVIIWYSNKREGSDLLSKGLEIYSGKNKIDK